MNLHAINSELWAQLKPMTRQYKGMTFQNHFQWFCIAQSISVKTKIPLIREQRQEKSNQMRTVLPA